MILLAYVIVVGYMGGLPSLFLLVGGVAEALAEAYILLERWLK